MQEADICFVVMPFGKKPKNDGSGGTYDFDKVYRVIIQRAIKSANMIPLRADETGGSRIIHADMFRDLRDRSVVLVDLSLLNPNVLYELGIRHVMSPSGTVLIANENTLNNLPFDIALSRTIGYKYDGEYLDWDEVEEFVPKLQQKLDDARRGDPDSPVYAFLDQVLAPHALKREEDLPDKSDPFDHLNDYQREFAKIWHDQGKESVDALIEKRGRLRFGIRAIGFYSLSDKVAIDDKRKIINLLYKNEEYDLVSKLYDDLDMKNKLSIKDLMRYGSAVSLIDQSIHNAKKGLKFNEKALEIARQNRMSDTEDIQFKLDESYAIQRYANMLARVWKRSQDEVVLTAVIRELREAIRLIEELLDLDQEKPELGIKVPTWRYAHNLLRLTMFFRVAEDDPYRNDNEKQIQKVQSLEPRLDELKPSKGNEIRAYKSVSNLN